MIFPNPKWRKTFLFVGIASAAMAAATVIVFFLIPAYAHFILWIGAENIRM